MNLSKVGRGKEKENYQARAKRLANIESEFRAKFNFPKVRTLSDFTEDEITAIRMNPCVVLKK